MKATELRSKNTDELNKELIELRRAQFNLRMQAGTQQLNNPDQVKKTRRNIARIKTVLAEKAKA
ncbi:MAG: 50S ribosomal protein L29 [Methylophilaceae bacterium]